LPYCEASMHPGSYATCEGDRGGLTDPRFVPADVDAWRENAQLRAQLATYRRQVVHERERADALLGVVIPAAIQLSVEQDFDRQLERILVGAKALCNADGGTLYLRTDDRLQFMLMHTTSLRLALGGTVGAAIPYPPLYLHDPDTARPNERHIATYAALHGRTVNIPDAYRANDFDFAGTRAFDRQTGYRSTSFLTVPLKHGPERVIGVIQLINALDGETGQVIPFEPTLQPVVEALASLAAIALASYIHEQSLREQIQQLRVEIDEARKARQVAAITETEHFQRLQERAQSLRRRVGAWSTANGEEWPCPES
jgi:GAF domain-containing protein